MKNFGLKFIDIMVGVVLGLGFQWWPNLHVSWQYAAFLFVYIDIVDYWIDYAPSLKKFPPRRELDLILDVAIMFSLFLYIYSTQLSFSYFLGAFVLFKFLDLIWLSRARMEHKPEGTDGLFINTWLRFNIFEIIVAAVLLAVGAVLPLPTVALLVSFIAARAVLRILASLRYKKVHFA